MRPQIRILLVDDSPHFLGTASEFINLQDTLVVVGTATDEGEALAQAIKLQPDVVLLDLNLGGHLGLDLIPFFKKHVPEAKIIILTIMENDSYYTASMQAGADAFVPKSDITKSLFSTIFELVDPATKDSVSFEES